MKGEADKTKKRVAEVHSGKNHRDHQQKKAPAGMAKCEKNTELN